MASNKEDALLPIEKIGAWLAVAASLSVATSALVEWSYLKGVGASIVQIPFGISDLTVGAIRWAPWIFIVIAAHVLGMTLASSDHIENAFDAIENNKIHKIKRIFFDYTIYIRIIFYTLALLYVIFYTQYYIFLLSGLIAAWIELIYAFFLKTNFGKKINRPSRFVIVLGGLFMLAVHGVFYQQGMDDIQGVNPSKIDLTDSKTLVGKVLRSYDAGFLIYTDRPIFVRRDHVNDIQFPPPPPIVGLPCYFWNVLCPSTITSPKASVPSPAPDTARTASPTPN